MWGIIFSIIAGAAMSVQGAMNAKLSESIGLFESNAYVQCVATLLSLAAAMVMGTGGIARLYQTDKVFLLGGVLGIVITITVMLGFKGLGPAVSVSIILIAQLVTAGLLEAFGLLGSEKMTFGWIKLLGGTLMIGGVVLFKLPGKQ